MNRHDYWRNRPLPFKPSRKPEIPKARKKGREDAKKWRAIRQATLPFCPFRDFALLGNAVKHSEGQKNWGFAIEGRMKKARFLTH
jgi:hypothetical protein